MRTVGIEILWGLYVVVCVLGQIRNEDLKIFLSRVRDSLEVNKILSYIKKQDAANISKKCNLFSVCVHVRAHV